MNYWSESAASPDGCVTLTVRSDLISSSNISVCGVRVRVCGVGLGSVVYHDEVADQQDGHQDGHHQVVQQREGPPGDVVQRCSLLLQPRVKVSSSSRAPPQQHHFTLLVTCTSAPLSSRYCTTLSFPRRHAAMRGVSPLSWS